MSIAFRKILKLINCKKQNIFFIISYLLAERWSLKLQNQKQWRMPPDEFVKVFTILPKNCSNLVQWYQDKTNAKFKLISKVVSV